MKKILVSFVFVFLALFSLGIEKTEAYNSIPTEIAYPKQQFRGVWLTTAWHLDVPKYVNEAQYKADYLDILEYLESMNMNAVIFQVRPMGGAFYPSEINPWDRYFAGVEGVGPANGWDPLEWMIEETHKHGMEFHAWFNPYRVNLTSMNSKNFAAQNPDFVVTSGSDKQLNPGVPEVQDFIIDTVMEVAENYDVDAIHFDDYFYPYSTLPTAEDAVQYAQYNPDNLSLANWRRNNVDNVIRRIKEELTVLNAEENKAVQLGISPFGIWANKSTTIPEGSNTNGGQSYSGQYADTRKWVKEGWVDYIAPQLYWSMNNNAAPYGELVDWWNDVIKGTNVNLYIGHGFHNYDAGFSSNLDEVNDQMRLNSTYNEVDGSIFFRYKFLTFRTNSKYAYPIQKIEEHFQYKVLPKPLKNVDSVAPNSPQNLTITKNTGENVLTWTNDSDAKAYYVYRYKNNEVAFLDDIKKVVDVIIAPEGSTVQFNDTDLEAGANYNYFVTTFDRANNESIASGINVNGSVVNPVPYEVQQYYIEAGQVAADLEAILELGNNLKTQKNELQDLLNQVRTSITETEGLYNDIISSIDEMTLEIETSITSEELNSLISEIDLLIIELNNSLQSKTVEELEASYDTANEKLENLMSKLSILNNLIDNGLADADGIKTLKNEFSAKYSALSSQFFVFRTKFNQYEIEVNKFEQRFDEISTAVASLESDLNIVTDYPEIKALVEGIINNYNQNKDSNTQLIEFYNSTKTEIGTITTTLNTFGSNNTKLNSKIKILENKINALEAPNATQVDTLESDLSNIKDFIDDLKGEEEPNPNPEPNPEPNPNDKEPKTDDEKKGNNMLPLIIGGVVVALGAGVAVISVSKKRS
jgi:uncharacterized lipoprotein YddW (UPF0748 family)/predicted nuclease with TOPRIM domain